MIILYISLSALMYVFVAHFAFSVMITEFNEGEIQMYVEGERIIVIASVIWPITLLVVSVLWTIKHVSAPIANTKYLFKYFVWLLKGK